ncbi:DUF3263 domain-containing protein [Corynebacterium sp.]|uniref:DUF3263 domain-containing protein n=1 Tax=Corynebacterium sp. TaxID=1720 RepID=UPI0039C89A95
MALSDRDRAIIQAAVGPHRDAGAELDALTWASGKSLAQTWQRLNQMLGQREAWEAEPVAMRILADRRRRGSRFTTRA